MILTIREGGFYKTRDGRKVGPMTAWLDYFECGGFKALRGGSQLWKVDGTIHLLDTGEEGDTLVAEWTDGPVVTETVTKTRIVPGVYDSAVEVNEWHVATRKVVLTFHGRVYDADQLDAAAAVLSALAKGLRDA